MNKNKINIPFYILLVLAPISIILKNSLISKAPFDSFPFRLTVVWLPYFLLLCIGYYIFRKIIIKIRRPYSPFTQKVQLISSLVIILVCIVFFNRLEIMHEIIFFHTHKDNFAELVDIGKQSKCYQSGSSCIEYVTLPEILKSSLGSERIFTLSGFQNRNLIATSSRANIYYVFVKGATPTGEKIYQDIIYCFHQLEGGWHLCYINPSDATFG